MAMATRKTRKTSTPLDALMVECIICQNPFQFGPHAHHGRHIKSWQADICNNCEAGNHDGVPPNVRPHLVEHLKAIGVEVALNAKGWIDLPPRGA